MDEKLIDVGVLLPAAHMKKYTRPIPYCFSGLFPKGRDIARKNGINLFMFSVDGIDPTAKTINGRFFDRKGRPYRDTIGYPAIVDNFTPGHAIRSKALNHLSKFATFTRSLTKETKKEKMDAMSQIKSLQPFLTMENDIIHSQEDLMASLSKNGGSVFVKPASGGGGITTSRSMYAKIIQNGDIITITDNEGERTLTKEEMSEFYQNTFAKFSHVSESFINSTAKNGDALVLRLTIKRGAEGKFVNTAYYCTTTPGVTAKLNARGSVQKPAESFLDEEFLEHKEHIEEQVAMIRSILINEFAYYRGREIFNFGIDLGIEAKTNGKPVVKIFEVNIGSVAVRDAQLNAEVCFGYYKYLNKKRQQNL
ncbi:MAG: hypothetical protein FWE21_00245 [Defluviitaleaceae bacterium]|nr:hypothetical protein [Defluviitaleaceae bacterium]